MSLKIEVLVVIDDVNKIYYTEDKEFASSDPKTIMCALNDYFKLLLTAEANGYEIVKREESKLILV